MSCIAVKPAIELERRVRAVPREPEMSLVGAESERQPPANGDFQPWELHSELVLVCPEVCERARELLPERDPDPFIARAPKPVVLQVGSSNAVTSARLPTALVGYMFWRVVETAWCALVAVGAVVALTLLADAVH
jgi:hypothetical protein